MNHLFLSGVTGLATKPKETQILELWVLWAKKNKLESNLKIYPLLVNKKLGKAKLLLLEWIDQLH